MGNHEMTRQQRAMLLFGLLLISAVLLGRTGLADAAQSPAEHVTALESQTSAPHDPDRGLRLTLGDVLFEDGGASLTASSAIASERLTQFMRDYPERMVRIEGHTDSTGSDTANQLLSERRVEAVVSDANGSFGDDDRSAKLQ